MSLNRLNLRQDQSMINDLITKFKNDASINVEIEVLSFIKNQLVNTDRSSLEISHLVDKLAIELNNLHPNYSKLASAIICNHHLYNGIPKNFSEAMKCIHELNKSLIADDVYNIIISNKDRLDQEIDHNNDQR